MAEKPKPENTGDDQLVKEMEGWDQEIPFDVADWGDRIVTYEGQSPEEIVELYPELGKSAKP